MEEKKITEQLGKQILLSKLSIESPLSLIGYSKAMAELAVSAVELEKQQNGNYNFDEIKQLLNKQVELLIDDSVKRPFAAQHDSLSIVDIVNALVSLQEYQAHIRSHFPS